MKNLSKLGSIITFVLLLTSCGGGSKSNSTDTTDSLTIEQNISGLGNWNIANYVDEFNEKTDKQYIVLNPAIGIFSNSATTNSELKVILLADTGHVEIRLYEYGGNHPAQLDGNVYFKIKEANGDIHEIKTFEGFTFNRGSDWDNKSDSLFRAILSRGGEIKFSAILNEYGNESSYNFTIPNADHFQEAINKTIGK